MCYNDSMDIKTLVKLAKEQGWEIELTKGNHYRFRNGKDVLVTSSTPSDHRTALNAASRLRKLGLDIPRKGQSKK